MVCRTAKLMGNIFAFTAISQDKKRSDAAIDAAIAEIARIERLLTTFNEESQTAMINKNAGIRPVKVDNEIFELIARSKRISDLTQGAFDITYGSVDRKLWNFDTRMTQLPDKETAKRMVRLINYRNIILDEHEHTVFLKLPGMRIGFGGIGKGYAAERAKAVMRSHGIESGVVNASGDVAVWGNDQDGKPWTIGVADPDHAGAIFSRFQLTDGAVATSGNYEKFAIIRGKKYSHTINPKTGLPVTGIKSVTIICANAELADAMATPVTIMGINAGVDMVNQIKGMECIIIDDKNRLHTSNNIHLK